MRRWRSRVKGRPEAGSFASSLLGRDRRFRISVYGDDPADIQRRNTRGRADVVLCAKDATSKPIGRARLGSRGRIGRGGLQLFGLLVLCGFLRSGCTDAQPTPAAAQQPLLRETKIGAEAFERGSPFPAWVDSIDDLPLVASTAPIVLRLADTQFYLAQKSTVFVHRATQANEASALAAVGQIGIVFQPDYQRVELHRLRILRGQQVIDKVGSADVRFMQRERELESGVYSGSVTAALVIDDVRLGDTLEVAYSVIGQNPVFGGRFFDAAAWDNSVPTAWRRVTLNSPDDRNIYHRVVGGEHDGDIPAVEKRAAGRRILRFEAKNLQPIDLESYVPVDVQTLRWIQFSEFNTWREVSRWANGLFETNAPAATLRTAVEKLRNLKSQSDKVIGALEFVQNEIRYLSIALGENSHKPFPPDQVLARRYGDCKDKSLLLVLMLKQLGIEASPVLVSTQYRRGLDAMLPSPSMFDHAIVRVMVREQVYFLDPTLLGQGSRLETLGQVHQGSEVLVVSPGTAALTQVAVPSGDGLITNSRTERVTVDQIDEPAKMNVRLQYGGINAEAARGNIARLTTAQLRKAYEGNLDRRYSGAELIGDPRISDDRAENKLTIELDYRIAKFFDVTGPDRIARYQAANFVDLFFVPYSAKRRYPLAMPSYHQSYRYELEITLPEAYDARRRPVERTLQDAAFYLNATVSFSGRVAKARLDFRTDADRVQPGEMAAFLDDLRQSGEMLRGAFVISPGDLKMSAVSRTPIVPFNQAVKERLERTVETTGKAIGGERLSGRDASSTLCERGLALAYLGREAEGLVNAQDAVRGRPDAPAALRCRGAVYFIAGDFGRSAADFSRAIALGLDDADTFFRRGLANYYLNRIDDAVDDFSLSVKKSAETGDRVRGEIWRTIALRNSRRAADWTSVSAANKVEDEWPAPALGLLRSATTIDDVLRSAHKEIGDRLEITLAEAYFYAGQYSLLSADNTKAGVFFKRVMEKGVLYSPIYAAARHELARLAVRTR